MAQTTIKNATGNNVTAALVENTGRTAEANGLPVTLSNEDFANLRGAPRAMAAAIVSVTTAVTGSNFTAFAAQACTALDICNTHPNAVDIEVRRGGAGDTIIVPAGSARLFVGITNSNQLQVRRHDTANSAVTVTGDALS